MFVAARMQRNVVTVSPSTSLAEARALMRGRNIHQLPVVAEDGTLVGILSSHDIRETILPASLLPDVSAAEAEEILKKTPVERVMTRKVITATLRDTLEDAIVLLHDFRLNALPVLDDRGRVAGIISRTDILEAFIESLGIGEVSSRLEVAVPDKPGGLLPIMAILKSFNVNIKSILTTGHPRDGMRTVFFRIGTMNPAPIKQAIREEGYRVLEVEDLRS
jgi:acetoin utilization protein AcuB